MTSRLLAVERTATQEGWPQEEWAGVLAPFLVRDAQKAYFDLPTRSANNYDVLKTKILARAGINTALRAQKYHSWTSIPVVQLSPFGQQVAKTGNEQQQQGHRIAFDGLITPHPACTDEKVGRPRRPIYT